MMSQANFFLQFKSVVNKSAELKIVAKKQFQTNLGPKVGLGPPQWGVWGAAATSLLLASQQLSILVLYSILMRKHHGFVGY